MRMKGLILVACLGLASAAASAAEPLHLTLKDHRFTPSHLDVPAGERFRITLTNQQATAAEFESNDMKFEKIAAPGATITVSAGPLRPGSYSFFDEYHPDLARGTVTATAKP